MDSRGRCAAVSKKKKNTYLGCFPAGVYKELPERSKACKVPFKAMKVSAQTTARSGGRSIAGITCDDHDIATSHCASGFPPSESVCPEQLVLQVMMVNMMDFIPRVPCWLFVHMRAPFPRNRAIRSFLNLIISKNKVLKKTIATKFPIFVNNNIQTLIQFSEILY